MEGQNPAIRENLLSPELQRKNLLQYLSGYFDASGIVSVQHNKATDKHGESFALRLDIEKANPTVVDLMQKTFPSFTTEASRKKKNTHRWTAKSNKALAVMEEIGPFLRIKAGHFQAVKEYSSAPIPRSKDTSLQLSTRVKELNACPENNLVLPFDIPYLAGIFDAHGYVFIGGHQDHNDISVRIGMKNERFMQTLANQLNIKPHPYKHHDVIGSYNITFFGSRAKDLLIQLKPFLKVNNNLANLAIELQTFRDMIPKPSHEQLAEKDNQILKLFREECARLQRIPHPLHSTSTE